MSLTSDPAGAARGGPARFALVARTSLGQRAAQTIKEMIVSGALRPGEALPPERELAVMLGISRPSLREAIRALSAMNVLEARHGGGTYVTSLDPRLLAQPISFLLQVRPQATGQLFEVRSVLEVGAVRLAAANATDEQLAALERLAEQAGKELRRPERYLELDLEIHATIVESTHNALFVSLYQSVADLSTEGRRRAVRAAQVRHRAHEDHLAVISALRQRDADTAAAAMQRHLEGIARLAGGSGTR